MGTRRFHNFLKLLSFCLLVIFAVTLVLGVFACAKAIPTPTPRSAYDGGFSTPTPRPYPISTPMPKPTPTPTLASPGGLNGGNGQADEGDYVSVAYEVGSETGRIIVRTVDTTLVVNDVAGAMDSMSALAVQMGGWVVSSDRQHMHSGEISIRVPAERLDETLDILKDMAVKVKSEFSTSQDFTDEYYDTEARVRNLQATEQALIGFLDKAENVEEALQVQEQVTKVQEDIEKLQGRLGYIEQSAAYSLVNIYLGLVPFDMHVDVGPDLIVSEGVTISFRASFVPPEGIDDFEFAWDFGDGSSLRSGTRTAPEVNGSSRTTSTVTYAYSSNTDSPFIVNVNVSGTGDAGAAEGADTLIVEVIEIDPIEVYAGADQSAVEGQEVSFSGSFTRPDGLRDFSFSWDFGDGSAPVTGDLSGEGTEATATHVYPNHRPEEFHATLTIMAESEAGTVEASDTLSATVRDAGTWSGSWSPLNTFKGAVRALSATGRVLGNIAIWLAILIPVWGGILFVFFFLVRRRRRWLRKIFLGEDDSRSL